MSNASIKLPDHPGDLIRLAVLDLVASASDVDRFQIYMADWFLPLSTGRCAVCFAGAVMAQTLHVDPELSSDPWDFDHETKYKLIALDALRQGDISTAYSDLRRRFPDALPGSRYITPWQEDRDLFLADMLDLASMIDDAEGKN